MAKDLRDGDAEAFAHLTSALGYTAPTANLIEAVTHKSYVNEVGAGDRHNERLEYLGDAVVDLVVAAALMEAHPDAEEGQLTRLRAGLVNSRSLGEEARRMAVGPALRIGRGEVRSGGREKSSLLADAYEALVGAIFLDRGYEAAREVVLTHFGPRMVLTETSVADRDHKTGLQEWVIARYCEGPEYRMVGTQGPDHAKRFFVEVWFGGALRGEGEDRSKKLAQRQAARQAWAAIKAGAFDEAP